MRHSKKDYKVNIWVTLYPKPPLPGNTTFWRPKSIKCKQGKVCMWSTPLNSSEWHHQKSQSQSPKIVLMELPIFSNRNSRKPLTYPVPHKENVLAIHINNEATYDINFPSKNYLHTYIYDIYITQYLTMVNCFSSISGHFPATHQHFPAHTVKSLPDLIGRSQHIRLLT